MDYCHMIIGFLNTFPGIYGPFIFWSYNYILRLNKKSLSGLDKSV